MRESYFRLQSGENKKQYGVILREKAGELEELTGFIELKRVGRTSIGTHYEADLNTNGHGEPMYAGGKHEQEIVGLTLTTKSQVEIHKQPKKPVTVSRIGMSEATKILEDIEYLRNVEAWL
ncbi:MAG: hypothetical protein ABSG05_03105 [Candidatus Pacearchaeota archaeon]|jgi:hypothetical protein